MPNRLANESSPYLRQHMDNPVDWYPWGPEALSRARAEDKPVFVSIGYAACHWCHVMAHESFENPQIAALMNSLFINIKVDREERPDVDAVYMNAIHVTGEGGGWPLSAFCDPEGAPFYLGTYFPPEDKYGRPGFPRVLKTMAGVWRDKREQVGHNTRAVLEGLRHLDAHARRAAEKALADSGAGAGDGASAGAALDKTLLVSAGRTLAQMSDAHQGGFGTRPKFPSSSSHDLLGRAGRLPFGKPAREAFLLQCQRMAAGGIYDHLGGGFSRYTVDGEWRVPHFEKMLYDNGQLLGIYGDAFAMTGEGRYRQVIEETVAWLEREMLDASGGLYASQDADSEGEEGKFYVWTPVEIEEVLGAEDAAVFCRTYEVTSAGNFENETTVLADVRAHGDDVSATGDERGRASAASEGGADDLDRRLAVMRKKLFQARTRRVPPATDDKILSAWNGLAVTGLLRAAAATGHEPARALALRVAEFLAQTMLHQDATRLWRVAREGQVRLDGTLDDYALVARAFLAVAQATGDEAWWRRGAGLVGEILERFYDEEDGVGVFYLAASDAEDHLVHRPESHQDGAMPSGASVAVECLLTLGRLAGDARALDVAERYLAGRAPQAAQQPYMASRLLAGVDLYVNGAELVVTGGAGRGELLRAAGRAYAPTLMIAGPWAAPALLDGKTPAQDGRAQAYLCRGQTCSAPVTDPAQLIELLAGSRAGS